MASTKKHVLVTGANSGIGLALVKLLTTQHDCHCYLGSRSLERGNAAKKTITDEFPATDSAIEVVQIDVTDDNSVKAAADLLKGKNVKLYGVVNNAGMGLANNKDGEGVRVILNTNLFGVQRVTEAFAPLIDTDVGRLVNVSSGAASMWLRNQDDETKKVFSEPTSFDALKIAIEKHIEAGNEGFGQGYGFSKACLTAMTILDAQKYKDLTVVSLSPGFIQTNMTVGMGAKLTAEEGCVSSIKCLFGDVVSGYYYGSDGLRSPLTMTRDPGTPEYEGEPNPEREKYNN